MCEPQKYQRGSARGLKDYLWIRFRTTAQRILINEALKSKAEGEFVDFDTYYSDFIDEAQLDMLQKIYQNPINFSDISSVFDDAISKSRATSITELERI